MKSNEISAFFSVAVGIYVWWAITKAAWKEANSFMGNPMKALAVTVIVAPIVGVIATTVIGRRIQVRGATKMNAVIGG